MGLLITAQFQPPGIVYVPDDPRQSEHLKGTDDLFLSTALQNNPPGNRILQTPDRYSLVTDCKESKSRQGIQTKLGMALRRRLQGSSRRSKDFTQTKE